MADETKKPELWTPRSVADTQKIYAGWANTYEADLIAKNYAVPKRMADALATTGITRAGAILDFGCGTGMAGVALAAAGFKIIDGTDITTEMLDHAHAKDLYRSLWLGQAGQLDFETAAYSVIVACGVISLGAAPPETLGQLLHKLGHGGLLAFSYNDPTLANGAYLAELKQIIDNDLGEIVFREHGPHLSEAVTGSDVIILQRT